MGSEGDQSFVERRFDLAQARIDRLPINPAKIKACSVDVIFLRVRRGSLLVECLLSF